MRARTLFLYSATTLAIGGALVSWSSRARARHLLEETAALQRRTHALRAQHDQIRGRIAAAGIQQEQLQVTLAAIRHDRADQSGDVRTHRPAAKPSWLELIRSDPKIQNLFLAYQRTGLTIEYGPLIHDLKLSPEQAAKFIDNVMRHREEGTDLETARLAKGLEEDDPAIAALRKEQQEAYDKSQRTVLGDDGIKQFKRNEEEKMAQLMVNDIAGGGIVAGVEFSREQIQRLTTVVSDASRNPRHQTDWDRVDDQARAFLNPQQLEYIKTAEVLGPMGAGWRFQNRLNDLILRRWEEDHAAQGAVTSGAKPSAMGE
jgi:hypothetical protein